MKTKLIWIMGLALFMAGCNTETFEPNKTNSNGDGISIQTKQSDYSSSIFMEAVGTITFGIKSSAPINIWWSDTGFEVINPSENMQYISHTFPPNSVWGVNIYNVESVTEFECKNTGVLTLIIGSDVAMALKKFDCSYNYELVGIDIYGNYPYLQEVYCNENALDRLVMKGNFPLMQVLECDNNNLTSLDCSDINNIMTLNVSMNYLASLDCYNMNNLQYLFADCNSLTNINLDGCYLRTVSLACNKLTNIDFSNALSGSNMYVHLYDNPLENSRTQSQAIANTMGQANGGSIIYVGYYAVNWFSTICGPKGWTVYGY